MQQWFPSQPSIHPAERRYDEGEAPQERSHYRGSPVFERELQECIDTVAALTHEAVAARLAQRLVEHRAELIAAGHTIVPAGTELKEPIHLKPKWRERLTVTVSDAALRHDSQQWICHYTVDPEGKLRCWNIETLDYESTARAAAFGVKELQNRGETSDGKRGFSQYVANLVTVKEKHHQVMLPKATK